MSCNDLSFRRKEKKYIIIEHSFDEIVNEISKHIPIYIYKGDEPCSQIKTTYLDTDDHILFNEYLNRRNFRFKIRLRQYGSNNCFEDNYLVEIKAKYKGISNKKRFILPCEHLNDFLDGKDIKSIVKQANQGIIGAQKTYKLISKLIELNNFKPNMQTSYERIAFQKKSKRVRLTIDKNIIHKKIGNSNNSSSIDALILESKVMGKTPNWLKDMVKKLSLLKQQRFSKFATGKNCLFYPYRGKYNFENETKTKMPENMIKSFELMKTYLKLEKFD